MRWIEVKQEEPCEGLKPSQGCKDCINQISTSAIFFADFGPIENPQ